MPILNHIDVDLMWTIAAAMVIAHAAGYVVDIIVAIVFGDH